MATNTTNYKLIKPAGSDKYNISIFNKNWDAIDTQMKVNADAIGTKQDKITGAATTVTTSNLTASRVIISNTSGKFAVSPITSTELGYLDGAKSNIQTQINNEITARTSADTTLQTNINTKVSKAGDTMTGDLCINGTSSRWFRITRADMDRTVDAEFPESDNIYAGGLGIYDKNIQPLLGVYRMTASNGVIATIQNSQTVNGELKGSNLNLIISPTGDTYATVPTPSNSASNNTSVATTAWVNSASTVVHTTGNETIGGTKTFTAMPVITGSNYRRIQFLNTGITPGDGKVSDYGGIELQDSTGTRRVMYRGAKDANDTNSARMFAYNTSGDTEVSGNIGVFATTDGTTYAQAPATRTSGYGSTDIVTAGWADAKISALNTSIYETKANAITGLSVSGKVITYTKGNGTTGTITTQDTNTTYTAGTGLSLSGTKFNHSNSITAGSMGGATSLPIITYDAQGHITKMSSVNIYPPTSVGTSGQYWKSDGSGTGIWQTPDTTPKSGSTNAITSGAVYTALAGSISGTAAKATADASGNVITTTYATKDEVDAKYVNVVGDTMTGDLYMEGSAPRWLRIKRTDIDRAVEQTFPESGTTYVGGLGVFDTNSAPLMALTRTVTPTNVTCTLQNSQCVNGEVKGANLNLIISSTGETYATVPTPSNSASNNTSVATTAWVNTADSVCHKTGNETWNGTKTFTAMPVITGNSYRRILFLNTGITIGDGKSSDYGGIELQNSDSSRACMFRGGKTDSEVVYSRIVAYNTVAGEEVDGTITVYVNSNGIAYASAPATRTSGYGSTDIATAGWVDTKINAIPKETWTFVLEDGSTITKEVLVG